MKPCPPEPMSTDWIEKARSVELQVRNFVNGRWQDGRGEPLEKYGPRDGRLLCRFGPVLSMLSFKDEEQAIQIANDTVYGLSAIVWTKDLGRAHRLAQRIDTGWIVVNATDKPTGGLTGGVMSIGGHKESGIGVEGGIEGLEAFTSSTAVQYFV